MSWLGELAKHATELKAKDVVVTAVAADEIADMAALQTTLPSISLVSDRTLAASKAWGRYIEGADSPTPATFVVDRDGVIAWSHLPDANGDWPTYAALAATLKL